MWLFVVSSQTDSVPKFPDLIVSLVFLYGWSALLLYCGLDCCWAMQLPGVLASLSAREGPGAILSNNLGCHSALLPWQGQTRLQGQQGFSFQEPNRAHLHPTEYTGHPAPLSWRYR